MGRYIEHQNAKEILRSIEKRPDRYALIHYSTTDLDEENPKITCITLQHFDNDERVQFSIQKYLKENESNPTEYAERKLSEGYINKTAPGKIQNLYDLNKYEIRNFVYFSEEKEKIKSEDRAEIAEICRSKVDFISDVLHDVLNHRLKVDKSFINKSECSIDTIKYFFTEPIIGRFIFWLIVTIFGAFISHILLEK